MSERTKTLMQTLLSLPEEERIEIANQLYDSASEGDADEAFNAELDRRADEIRKGIATGRPVDVVMKEMRERFP